MKSRAILLTLLVLVAAAYVAAGAGPAVKAGDTAPLFEGVDQHGKTIRLEDFKGKSDVVLYFYPKDGTPGCTAQACSLRDGYKKIEAAGAVVIGVSADSRESHAKFAASHGLPFSILPDPDHTLIKRYGVGMPVLGIAKRTTFVIGRDGKVRAVIPSARTSDHDRQVLEILAGTR